ncbi:MAG: prepilin peptidase [Chloroflexi bacterium]|nr:prepilin peptidase [Chloroflexota bacterium]
MPVGLVQDAILIAFVAVTVFTDWRWRRIPNAITFPVIVGGLALGTLESFPGVVAERGFVDKVAGLVVAFLVVWPLNRIGGIKGGDAKFLMAIGALRGVPFFFASFFYGALAGGVLALVLMALRRLDPPDTPQTGRVASVMKSQIPYGLALGAGALFALWRGTLGA